MKNTRKDFDIAETLYQQAIDADPNNAHNFGNFAEFLEKQRKDFDRAETLYQQAIKIQSDNIEILRKFALFMENQRCDPIRSKELYKQISDLISLPEILEENDMNEFKQTAKILFNNDNIDNTVKTFTRILDSGFYEKLKKISTTADNDMLNDVMESIPIAVRIQLYNTFLEIDPHNIDGLKELVQLYLIEGEKTQGKIFLDRAFAINPESAAIKLELWFYRLAHFPQDYPQAQAEIMALLETGARSEGWDFSGNIAQAEKDGHPNMALLQTLADTITQQTSEPQASIL